MRSGRRNGAAALVLALLLMACNGGGGDGDGAAETSPAASAAETTAAPAVTDAPTTAPATIASTTTTIAPVAVDVPCPSDRSTRCGTVAVPLDRADPAAGTIDIYFEFVQRSDISQPAAGTLLGLTGGPGPATLNGGPGAWADWAAAVGPYDLLLTDYRGTGRSGALQCAATQDTPFPGEIQAARSAVATCGQEIGGRAPSFDTVATADDLEAVRTALGLGPVDILGISHGTYVAQVFASRHPDGVRSLALDGAVPMADSESATGTAWYSVPNLQAAITALATICSRSAGACAPDQVAADLQAAIEQVRATPSPGLPDAAVLGRVLLDPANQPVLPGALRAAASGDRSRLEQLAAPYLAPPSGVAPLADFSAALSASIACNDFAGTFDESDRTAREAQVAAELEAIADSDLTPFTAEEWGRVVDGANGYRSLCVGWPVPESASGDEQAFPRPDVPALVMNGDLDLLTPLEGARQVAADWSGAILVEFPNVGHTPVLESPCALTVIREFVQTLAVADVGICSTSTPPVVPAP